MTHEDEKKNVFIAAYGAAFVFYATQHGSSGSLEDAEYAASVAESAVSAYFDDSEYMDDGPSGPVQHTLRKLGLQSGKSDAVKEAFNRGLAKGRKDERRDVADWIHAITPKTNMQDEMGLYSDTLFTISSKIRAGAHLPQGEDTDTDTDTDEKE